MTAGTAEAEARALVAIDKYLNPIADPSRLRTCPALIRDMACETQRKRHVFVGAAGEQRERLPMAVIAASYFVRTGNVIPTTILDIVYRDDPSTTKSPGDA